MEFIEVTAVGGVKKTIKAALILEIEELREYKARVNTEYAKDRAKCNSILSINIAEIHKAYNSDIAHVVPNYTLLVEDSYSELLFKLKILQ
jgi:hypothetical protein